MKYKIGEKFWVPFVFRFGIWKIIYCTVKSMDPKSNCYFMEEHPYCGTIESNMFIDKDMAECRCSRLNRESNEPGE